MRMAIIVLLGLAASACGKTTTIGTNCASAVSDWDTKMSKVGTTSTKEDVENVFGAPIATGVDGSLEYYTYVTDKCKKADAFFNSKGYLSFFAIDN